MPRLILVFMCHTITLLVFSCLGSYILNHVLIQRGGGGGDRASGPPLKYHKNIGFLINTGPDSLTNHTAAKLSVTKPRGV